MQGVASQVNIERALTIGGWMSERELIWLATQASKYNRIVEFGSFHGRSTRALADNSPDDAHIWAVDPWSGEYRTENGDVMEQVDTYVMPYFCMNLMDHIRTGKVTPFRTWSYRFSLPHLVDMVFIDGDHRYQTVIKDINKAIELLENNGLICGHDWDHPTWPGVRKAVTELLGNDIQVEDSIWWKNIQK